MDLILWAFCQQQRQHPHPPLEYPGMAAPGQLNTEIFREPGRFAGWPANYGMWGFGEEVVCCCRPHKRCPPTST